jgi:putative tricarboxylic transport membrane protein
VPRLFLAYGFRSSVWGPDNIVTTSSAPPHRSPASLLRRQDFVGGLIVIATAIVALWQGSDLPLGTFGSMGPGMLPRGLAVLLGLLGALLVLDSFIEGGLPLERWSLRGPLFILAAVVAFGMTVRPLGLLVAGPLAIVISAFASTEVRWGETLLFGALMTVFCIGLFKFALALPIPLAPWLLGY